MNIKKNTLFILLALFIYSFSFSQSFIEIANETSSDAATGDLFGIDVDHTTTHAIFGAPGNDYDEAGSSFLSEAGAAYIFPLGGIPQKIVASDRSANDSFGWLVAIDGIYAVVGSPSATKAYVFKMNVSGIWQETQILTVSGASKLGHSLAISGETIVLGDWGKNEAHIFDLDPSGTWVHTQTIEPSVPLGGSRFAYSVAIDNDNIVIGSTFDKRDENDVYVANFTGSCYIFNRDAGGVWLQKQKVVASDIVFNQHFGSSVAISGDHFIIGAIGEKRDFNGNNPIINTGAAYLFKYDSASDTWSELQKISASNRNSNDQFGSAVDINDDILLIGRDGPSNPEVELYRNNGGATWTNDQTLVTSSSGPIGNFGKAVSVKQPFLLVGRYSTSLTRPDNTYILNAGSCYIYMQLPCAEPDIFNAVLDTECGSGLIDIHIDGNLNSPANFWSVYTGDCGQTLVGTSNANDFSVSVPPGTTALFIRGEDGPGCVDENSAVCFNITVTYDDDTTPPVAICQDITIYLDNSGTATITAQDIDGGSYDDCGNVNMAAAPLTYDCDDIGDNTATLQIWDDSGNGGFCNATVTVVDNMNLVVACQDITISLDASGNASIVEADIDGGTYDNCNEVFMAAAPKNFDVSNVGDNTVWLQVWTNEGEFGYCTANVHVLNPFAFAANETIELSRMTSEKSMATSLKNTGRKLVNGNSDIELFPNPVVSEFTLRSNDDYPINKVRIMNSSFSEVLSLENSNPIEAGINIEELPQGMYFIVIYSGDETFVKKLIKI